MKLLVVVDYQKDFVDGALGFAGAEKLDAGIAEKIRTYGQCGNIYLCPTVLLVRKVGKPSARPHRRSLRWKAVAISVASTRQPFLFIPRI